MIKYEQMYLFVLKSIEVIHGFNHILSHSFNVEIGIIMLFVIIKNMWLKDAF